MRRLFIGLTALLLWAGQAAAQFTVTITLDEKGNGRLTNTAGANLALPSGLFTDPGPGGRPTNALTYDLLNPPGLVAGDVFVNDGSGLSDVIRFNTTSPLSAGAGSLVLYSQPGGGELADLAGFPTSHYSNTLTINELNGLITYTPTQGQPGFVAGAAGPVTYVITSPEPTIPEPTTLALFGLGTAGLAGWRLRRKNKQATA
jgi:hypothetical protein